MNWNDIITIYDASGFENEFCRIDEISLNGTDFSVYWSEDTREFYMLENGDGRQQYYDVSRPGNSPFSVLEHDDYIKEIRNSLCVKADEAYVKGDFDIALNIFLEAEEKRNIYMRHCVLA